MRPIAAIVIAYLLGSIPFGYLIVRAREGADIRRSGSGGTGATNVSRRAGKAAGVLTLVLDALKGAAAVAIAKAILELPIVAEVGHAAPFVRNAHWWVAAAAVTAILGHVFPVWLRFRGGKGVATGVGVFLILAPIVVALAGLIFVVIVWRTRYVSLASMVAALTIPVFVLLQNSLIRPVESLVSIMSAAVACAALILFAHRQNIGRLIDGTESRFK